MHASTYLFLAISASLFCNTALAQYGQTDARGLSTSASAKIELVPSRVKLVMWIEAKELDAKTAVQVLMQHREKVRDELKKLMVIQDSVAFSSIQIEKSEDDEEQQEMIGRLQMMGKALGGNADVEAPEVPKSFTAFCALKAEWKIPDGNEEQIAILPAMLREHAEKRDLAGKSNQPKMDDAIEQQLQELKRMAEEQMGPFYDYADNAEMLQVYFVGDYTDEEVEKAAAEAITKARKRGVFLAKAAGTKLGTMVSLSTNLDNDLYYDDYGYGYDYDSRSFPTKFIAPGPNSVQAATTDELVKEVEVYLTYDMPFAK